MNKVEEQLYMRSMKITTTTNYFQKKKNTRSESIEFTIHSRFQHAKHDARFVMRNLHSYCR